MKTTMRNRLFVLFAAAVLAGGCEKKVIDIDPIDRVTPDLAFSTAERIEGTVVGGYDGLQSAEFLSGRALIYADLWGEDVIDKNGFFGDLPRFNILSTNAIAASMWNAAYQSIGRANRAIDGINASQGILTEAKSAELIAESKFIRAIAHFYLVNFYAQSYGFTAGATHPGIPLILQGFTANDPAANQPRATVAEVYSAVITDLNDAIAALPANYGSAALNKARATKGAAAALLSRVYLYQGDYQNAKTIAGRIINGEFGNYALNPSPVTVFRNYTTAESIFSIPNSANDNPNTNNALPQHYYEAGRGDIIVSPTFTNAATNPYFAADDLRRDLIDANEEPANAGYFYTSKYADVTTRADWAPVIRYAEVLLTYAEASARLANAVDADAIEKLNLVRDRAQDTEESYEAADFASAQELINAILGERRIELAFEGHRYFDLVRTKANLRNKFDSDLTTPISIDYGADKFIFPIPQVEVDKSNGVLVQNPGY
jgi:hypothetical protein